MQQQDLLLKGRPADSHVGPLQLLQLLQTVLQTATESQHWALRTPSAQSTPTDPCWIYASCPAARSPCSPPQTGSQAVRKAITCGRCNNWTAAWSRTNSLYMIRAAKTCIPGKLSTPGDSRQPSAARGWNVRPWGPVVRAWIGLLLRDLDVLVTRPRRPSPGFSASGALRQCLTREPLHSTQETFQQPVASCSVIRTVRRLGRGASHQLSHLPRSAAARSSA
jgi:hypothetical protein